MKYSYNWLKEYIPKLPNPQKLEEALSMHAFEVDSIDKKDGDYIFDIKILNRTSDVGGHIGMAHEIAAILDVENKAYSKQLQDFMDFKHLHPDRLLKELLADTKGGVAKNSKISVHVEDANACPRYMAYQIDGVKLGKNPPWLNRHLKSLNVNSINLLVDLTNFVMLKIGQPMHIFDADKLSGDKIFIRFARRGEKMTTLDGIDVALDSSMLIIADEKGPLAIAGVKGGNRAAVTKETKNIIIESANFDRSSIRSTSRATKIMTDASQRYAQGLDPNLAEYGLGLLVRWILEYAGGSAKGFVDNYPKPQYPRKIGLRLEKVEKILGENIGEEVLLDIFRRLAFKVKITSTPREEIVKLANSLLGKEYYYGASAMYDAPVRFDCSSFVLYIFRQLGIELPRMSFQQYYFGFPTPDDKLLPGDLVFRSQKKPQQGVSGDRKNFGHVGIYIGNNRVIHASSDKKKVVEEALASFKKYSTYKGGIRVISHNDGIHFIVEVPTMRKDLMIEEDLVEEIGRIYGYEKIEPKNFAEPFLSAQTNINILWQNKIKNFMVSSGYYEADTYIFVGKKELELFGEDKLPHWELENPIRQEMAYLRRTAAPLFLDIVARNYDGNDSLKYFEIGKVFLPESNSAKKKDPAHVQFDKVSGAIWSSNKVLESKSENFYMAKGSVISLFESAGISDVWLDDVGVEGFSFLHPFRSALIKAGDATLGYIGAIHPKIQHTYGIKKGEMVIFEIDFAKFVELAEDEIEYKEPSKYPSIVRDIAIVAPNDARVSDVEDVLQNTGSAMLYDTDLFDLYEGENVEQGNRSMAFHLTFQSSERTLRDDEINSIVEKIIKACESKGWEVRK